MKEFVIIIVIGALKDWYRYWVVHIPFVCMVESKFPAHFPVDHLADPVVSRLILLLC